MLSFFSLSLHFLLFLLCLRGAYVCVVTEKFLVKFGEFARTGAHDGTFGSGHLNLGSRIHCRLDNAAFSVSVDHVCDILDALVVEIHISVGSLRGANKNS